MRFSVQAVDEGGRPMLPNGQQGVSRDQAICAARDTGLAGVEQAHNLLPNVQVAAQYGLFTRGRPGMQILAYSQNRPVWVITFYGPNVVFPPLGPRPPGSGVHHFVSIVID